MKIHLVMILVCIPLLWLGCSDKRTTSADKKGPSKVEIDSLSKEMLQIFSVNSGDEYKFDGACLCFYGSAAYDTTTLLQLKKHEQTVTGVYYQILPGYHRFISDYADRNTKLLFFEGYSFTIDTTVWQSIVSQAKLVLQEKINKNALKVTDGVTYGLLYNNQIQQGRTGTAILENFDRFLKDSVLDKFVHARKPKIIYKNAK
jgi:hypothetical protein